MKMILFDLKCVKCNHVFEDFVQRESYDNPNCPKCHGETSRLLSAPRLDTSLGVDAASFPTLGDKWVRNRKQHQRIEERRKLEHGS